MAAWTGKRSRRSALPQRVVLRLEQEDMPVVDSECAGRWQNAAGREFQVNFFSE